MRRRLLLIEGIPGAGKTTLAQKCADYLNENGAAARAYLEGGAHPADLAWCACLDEAEFTDLCARYPERAAALRAHCQREGGRAVVAYLGLGLNPEEALFQELESREIYDGRGDRETFCRIHLARWERFGREAARRAEISVFECAFMQNHVNECTLFYQMSERELAAHLGALYGAVASLKPLVLYLRPEDVEAALAHVARERVNERGEPVWAARVEEYVADSPYGRAHGLRGWEGLVAYMRSRVALEERLLRALGAETREIARGDWDERWRETREMLGREFLGLS